MLALKEFINFITHHKATLAQTYAQLLAEGGVGYENFPPESRIASARRVLNAVMAAYEVERATPLCNLFDPHNEASRQRWPERFTPPQPMLEVECLGQTLTAVVTNLEAGKFLWQILAETRAVITTTEPVFSTPSVNRVEPDQTNLSALDQKYQALLDTLPIGIYRNVPGPKGHFLEVNQAIAAMFEAESKTELLKYNVSDLYQDPADRQRFSDKLAKQGFLKNEVLKLKTLKGQEIWGAVTAIKQQGEKGQVYFDGIIEDVTKRKQTEEALRESEEKYHSLVDGFPQNVYQIDRNGRVIFGNKTYLNTVSMTLEEVTGKTAYDFFSKDLADKYTTDDQRVMETGEILDVVEDHRVPATGEIVYVHTVKTPVRDRTGNIVGVQGIFWDVTERVRTEETLARRAVQLETVAKVSTAASTILEMDKLVDEAVNLMRDSFDFYYVGLFLVDEAKAWAVLRAGTGEAGRIQLERKHQLEIGGESMIGWSVANRQARIALDVGEEAVRFQNPILPDTRSEMALPLISRNEILGALTVQSVKQGAFSAEDIKVLQAMADQVANAIVNARLFEQLQTALTAAEVTRNESGRQAQEANILDRVSQALITEPDLGVALHAVTETMVKNFEAAFARLWTVDDSGQTLLLQASSGLYTHLDGGHARVPVGKFKIGLIAQERQPHLTNDILHDPRLGDPEWAKKEGMVAFAGYPLLVGERLIGVLAMFARQPLPQEVLAILGRLADRAAVAIDNRRLLEAAQRRAQRERVLYEVSTSMRQSLNPDTIIKTGLAAIGQELGHSGITIHLTPPNNGK